MPKIKVTHIITLLELGGAQQNTLFTVKHLNREKFEASLICGMGGLLDDEAKKIPDLKLSFIKNFVRPIHPFKDILCLLHLIRILKRDKPQIVHTHSSKAGILGRIAAWCAKVPIIIHSIHGFGFNPYQKFFVRWLFIWLEKWCAKMTTCLIAVSKENIREGVQCGIGTLEKYALIRSGVDILKIKKTAQSADPKELKKELGIPDDSKIVLNVSPFKIQKNPVAFVQVAEKVIATFPNVYFVLVGDGELREAIEKTVRLAKIESQFKLLGWKRNIPEILNLTDIFVLTSLWEGLPRAAVESLIIGKPVVAFAVNGLKEIVHNGENGFLITPNMIEEMSEKILLLLKNENLRSALSRNATASIDDSFDINKMVRQQEELYQQLLIRQSVFMRANFERASGEHP